MNEPIRSRSALKQENEVVAGLAAQEAAGRSAAENIAALEILQRQQAENAAIDARIAANQAGFQAAQLNTERELLRDNLAAERAAASNANFGLVLVSAIALVSLLAFGIWYTSSSHAASNSASAGSATQTARYDANTAAHDSTVTTPAPSRSTQSEYRPAASAIKVPAAKPHAAKSAPAAISRPSKTPSSDSADSASSASDDSSSDSASDDSSSDSADNAADSNSADKSADDAGTDAKPSDDSTGK